MRNHVHSTALWMASMTLVAAVVSPVAADGQTLVITRGTERQTREAPRATFTGTARIDMLFDSLVSADVSGGSVSFEPGARTAWHVHPGGQTLIVTAGVGRVQRSGDAIEEIRAGDVVRIPAGQKHWHGAAPEAAMTHIAISEPRGGRTVEWMEQVSDEQYHAAPQRRPPAAAAMPEGQAAPAPATAQAESANRRPSGPLATETCARSGDADRRCPLRRRVATRRAVVARAQSGDHREPDCHRQDGAAHRTPWARARQRLATHRDVGPVGAPGDLQRVAQCRLGACGVRAGVHRAKIDVATLRAAAARLPAGAEGALPGASGAVAGRAPKFAQLTRDVVFDDLWRRSDLAPRDRNLATIAALASMGDGDQLAFYVRRGLDAGLTHEQIAEAVTHLGFYAGWGKATTAMQIIAALSPGAAR